MKKNVPANGTVLDKPVDRFVGILVTVGGLALFLLMATTVVAVVWRYVLNDPIFGIEDLTTMILTVVVGSAVACAASRHNHVGVNVIKWFFGRRFTKYSDFLSRVLTLLIACLATWALFDKSRCGLPCGAITNNLSISHTPFYMYLGAAFFGFAAVVVVDLIVGAQNWHGDDPNEPED